jgi:hypothetical protein
MFTITKLSNSKICLLFAFFVACFLGCQATTTQQAGSSTIPSLSSFSPDAGRPGIHPVEPNLQGLPPEYLDAGSFNLDPTPPTGALSVLNAAQNGERITPLRAGTQAPFNGLLFNGPATAYIQVEFTNQAQRCLIDRHHDLALVIARYNADTASLNLALGTQRAMDQVILNGRDADITSLLRLNQELQRRPTTSTGDTIRNALLWGGGGFLVGVLIVAGIVVYTKF